MPGVKQLATDAVAEWVRSALAGGVSATSAATLLQARDGGLGRAEATRAVADGMGLAQHYAGPVQVPVVTSPLRRRFLTAVLWGLLACIVLRPLRFAGSLLTLKEQKGPR